jgi:multidrug efflux pump subunit AcrA (membrane-fusion protein)
MSAPVRMSHRFTALESVKVPRVMRTVFYMLLIAFLSALVFLIYAPWVQTATGRGAVNTLNPNERKQDINALVPGRIEQWYVRDGSAVKQGDPIVRIADIDPQLIDRLQAEREQIAAQLQAALVQGRSRIAWADWRAGGISGQGPYRYGSPDPR